EKNRNQRRRQQRAAPQEQPRSEFSAVCGASVGRAAHGRIGNAHGALSARLVVEFLLGVTWHHFGMGSMTIAPSANEASPDLPLMRYWTFNCFRVPGAGYPPKLVLKWGAGNVISGRLPASCCSACVTSFCV